MPTFSLRLLFHSFPNISISVSVRDGGCNDFFAISFGGNRLMLEAPRKTAEAATTVGYPGGEQKGGMNTPGRPIFGPSFYGQPLAVAISVGSNGFVVGMNRSSLETFKQKTGLRDEDIAGLASWPSCTKGKDVEETVPKVKVVEERTGEERASEEKASGEKNEQK